MTSIKQTKKPKTATSGTVKKISDYPDSDDAPKLIVQVKKKDLIERVMETTGLKKREVGLVIEAALAAMADDMSQGKEMNLPPLGKIKINRTKDVPSGKVLIARIKMPREGAQSGLVPLAGDDD